MRVTTRSKHARLPEILAAVFLFVGIVRIASTYTVFSQTWDEPVHVASGMEWLQNGTYTYEVLHPPLARIAVAVGPYLRGIRMDSDALHPKVLVAGGNAVFAHGGDYIHNLTLARIGVLPFFVICVATLWHWTRQLYDPWIAAVAVGLFTALPPILGHAGLATTDFPLTATFTLALFALTKWFERPAPIRSVALGVTAGAAILTKFTALLFLTAGAVAVLLCWLFAGGVTVHARCKGLKPHLKSLCLAFSICSLLILACYRFSFQPALAVGARPHLFLDHLFGATGKWHDLAYHVAETTPVPMPEFFEGVEQARGRGTSPTPMYLLGQVRNRGWWYFFPIAIMVKTPIPFLLLIAIGSAGIIAENGARKGKWQSLVPFVSALALLAVCLPTKFNIGLRHILPIYPPLSIVGAFGMVAMCRGSGFLVLRHIAAGTLGMWMLVSSAMAQPDNLAYFNELAGNHPERILVDSDLDWGQDLLRLSKALQTRRVGHISIAYNGSADLSKMNLPPYQILDPCGRTTGWVAVSVLKLEMSKSSVDCGGYSWLQKYSPIAIIGKSIWLYWIPDNKDAGDSTIPNKRESRKFPATTTAQAAD